MLGVQVRMRLVANYSNMKIINLQTRCDSTVYSHSMEIWTRYSEQKYKQKQSTTHKSQSGTDLYLFIWLNGVWYKKITPWNLFGWARLVVNRDMPTVYPDAPRLHMRAQPRNVRAQSGHAIKEHRDIPSAYPDWQMKGAQPLPVRPIHLAGGGNLCQYPWKPHANFQRRPFALWQGLTEPLWCIVYWPYSPLVLRLNSPTVRWSYSPT